MRVRRWTPIEKCWSASGQSTIHQPSPVAFRAKRIRSARWYCGRSVYSVRMKWNSAPVGNSARTPSSPWRMPPPNRWASAARAANRTAADNHARTRTPAPHKIPSLLAQRMAARVKIACPDYQVEGGSLAGKESSEEISTISRTQSSCAVGRRKRPEQHAASSDAAAGIPGRSPPCPGRHHGGADRCPKQPDPAFSLHGCSCLGNHTRRGPLYVLTQLRSGEVESVDFAGGIAEVFGLHAHAIHHA